MEPGREDAPLETALADLGEVWSLLRCASPDALDRCAVVLDHAARRVQEWRAAKDDARAGPSVIATVRALRAAARGAGRLLESAAAFHARRRSLVGCLCAGYTPSGGPPATAPPARVCLQG